jgi:serine/threonine kinase 32
MTDPSVVEQSPERQMMDEKFVTYDYTKPYENENRKKMIEQKYWAQRMNKTTSEKHDINSSNSRKAAATYKTSVLDYLNQKPATPLSAGDILKLEELARSARSGAVKDKGTEWRPPSGLIGNALAGTSQLNDIQARDEFILQNGGVPPPSRPPPIVSHYNKDSIHTTTTTTNTNNQSNYNLQQQQSYQSKSSDSSYRLASSPDNSEYPLISSTAAISIENLHQMQVPAPQPQPQDVNYLYATSTISTASSQTLHDSNKSTATITNRPTPVRMSSIPRFHGTPLPPPTSLPPPIPTELPPLPPVPKDYI